MIEDLIEKIEEKYIIHKILEVPLHGNQFLYEVTLESKPAYTKEQLRLWDNTILNRMAKDYTKNPLRAVYNGKKFSETNRRRI